MSSIIESLRIYGWIVKSYDVDEIIDVGEVLLCFKDNKVIGMYDTMYKRIDDVVVFYNRLVCYHKGECVGEVRKMM